MEEVCEEYCVCKNLSTGCNYIGPKAVRVYSEVEAEAEADGDVEGDDSVPGEHEDAASVTTLVLPSSAPSTSSISMLPDSQVAEPISGENEESTDVTASLIPGFTTSLFEETQLDKRHDYALDCSSTSMLTLICSKYPYKYYCSSAGAVTLTP